MYHSAPFRRNRRIGSIEKETLERRRDRPSPVEDRLKSTNPEAPGVGGAAPTAEWQLTPARTAVRIHTLTT
jgi:hypothetical protein